MKIGNTGAWQNNSLEGHVFDPVLASSIVNFLKQKNIKSVYDFGCGHGNYTNYLNENEIICSGFDGNPYTENITNGVCKVLDLSIPASLEPVEYVLTLEVAEHLPKQFENFFIENVNKHNTKGVILSWAIVGQGGDGHFNEQNNDYVKNLFSNLGYKNLLEEEQKLRINSTLPWFKNTIMIFEK